MGAQGTGKTTLLHALRSEKVFKDYKICDESTRWVKNLGFEINQGASDNTQILIAMKHIYNMFMYENQITDRTIIDCYVYTTYQFSNAKLTDKTYYEIEKITKKLLPLYDKIFYLEPEFKIEDDGVRSIDKQYQQNIVDGFNDAIYRFKVPFVKLTGSVRERVEQVLGEIKKYNDGFAKYMESR